MQDKEKFRIQPNDSEWARQDEQPPNDEKAATAAPPSAGLFRRHSPPSRKESSTEDSSPERLHWRERIRHYTWTFFTVTMATGGVANVLFTGETDPLEVFLRVAG